MADITRISLNEVDLVKLFTGKTLRHGDIEIGLNDLGRRRIAEVAIQVSNGIGLSSCDKGCASSTKHYGACLP